jgi:molybdenum cofactor biosynthesis protein B
MLPWRPPQNRDPTPEEISMLQPFVRRHVELAAPEVLILMGNWACVGLLGKRGITRMRGNWEEVLGRPALPMFHPAYLLRQPGGQARGLGGPPVAQGETSGGDHEPHRREPSLPPRPHRRSGGVGHAQPVRGHVRRVLVERLTGAGHTLAARHILPDERDQIAEQLRAWVADPGIDVILTTGGTGLTGRDVTVEAHRDVYEKEIEAFATVFTMVSMQKIGTSAVQSRATGGVANGTYLFALPGSSGACKDAWDEILKWQLDYRHRPCNFVEILPRLDEHLRRK